LAIFLALGCSVQKPDSKNLAESAKYLRADEQQMQWWRESRFGLFIHWGPVSLEGTEIGWSRGKEVPIERYDNLYKKFNPVNFSAKEWVGIAKSAGAKYLVVTSKHHDGFCIFDSKYTDYDIMSTPFKRDVVGELADECKKQEIKFSLYYSIIDWYHPDYLPRGAADKRPVEDAHFERYVTYMKNQLKELVDNYGPLEVLWFDGYWESYWTHEHGKMLYKYVKALQPGIIINNRADTGRVDGKGTTKKDQDYAGDFDTPEQEIGTFQMDPPWETCMTLCTQWAWKPDDDMKSLKECIDVLVRTAGGDGNLLLNVGPMPDGRIEPRQVEQLNEVGKWFEKYGKSIYATRGGPFEPGDWGASTRKDNRIYVHVLNWRGDMLKLPPIPATILASSVLTGGTAEVKQTQEGIDIYVPKEYQQDIDTIIVLELDGPADELAPVAVRN
jgi:alpha-L-fucosidase